MFKDIGTILEDVVKGMGIKKKIEGNKVFKVWDEVVGDIIEKNTEPYFFKKGILFIGTTSSVWAQELSMMKQCLIKKVNDCFKKEKVKDIRFKVMNIKKDLKPNNEPVMKNCLKETKLNQGDLKDIDVLVKDIKDNELRCELKKIMVIDKKRKKIKPKVNNG